ncbi:MAG: tripartite tricarboxylate transporter substrate binding protein [Rhodocyclaceae bacterium]|nr:tripartite tricarboxylate transporter substrate binding protein [Rhodocyclaceae bacterium]MCA3132883.1 tripartite tricarboxylate transporter substrate binding protein [Rhodocyclaceae bacterium]MCA3147259.1 tripartite tricarboxylate transporter substrate binding protein [Rhodocyclaceae bacterium]
MRFLLVAAAALLAAFVTGPVQAQEWPAKPIRLVVPFPPGGTPDILARLLGQRAARALGQQVVVDNRPGAGGNVAMEIVARSAPDGYTVVMGTIGTCALNPSLYANLPFSVQRDFAPVMLVGSIANLLAVHPSVPATSVKELVALAKARPGTLTYASSGFGSSLHVAGELFRGAATVDLVHVPYKGSQPALMDLVAGQVNLIFDNMPSVLPMVQAGKVRPLAVTGAKRSRLFPALPTMAEAGYPEASIAPWYGVLAPARVPGPVLAKLNAAFNEALRDPAVQKRLAEIDLEPAGGSGAQFAALIAAETDKWGRVIREKGIRAE